MKNSNLTRILHKRWAAAVGAALVAMGALSAGEVQALTLTGGGYYATDDINDSGSVTSADFKFENISITGTEVLAGAAGKDQSVSQNLNFTFNFFGSNYTNVSFSSNGLLTFGGTNSSPNNLALSDTQIANPSIATLWDDWYPNAGSVYYQTKTDSNGKKRFIVQWDVTGSDLDAADPMRFQVVLYENNSDILFSYSDVDTFPESESFGSGATVGIRNSSSQNLQWSNNNSIIRNKESILYRKVPFEFSPGMSLLALGAVFAASRLKSKLQKRKSFKSEFSSN